MTLFVFDFQNDFPLAIVSFAVQSGCCVFRILGFLKKIDVLHIEPNTYKMIILVPGALKNVPISVVHELKQNNRVPSAILITRSMALHERWKWFKLYIPSEAPTWKNFYPFTTHHIPWVLYVLTEWLHKTNWIIGTKTIMLFKWLMGWSSNKINAGFWGPYWFQKKKLP